MGARLLSDLTLSAVCLYYLSEFGRMFGKNIFEKRYFSDELHMPTTNFLMHSDRTFSLEYKKKFAARVHSEFGLTLPKINDQLADDSAARARIVEAMALVRKQLMGNKFLLQHNIEYGAMRNAIGGALLGTTLSLLNMWFFLTVVPNELPIILSIGTLALYLVLLLSSKLIMDFYGRNYAKVLFREYMGRD